MNLFCFRRSATHIISLLLLVTAPVIAQHDHKGLPGKTTPAAPLQKEGFGYAKVATPNPAELPPLLSDGPTAEIFFDFTDETFEIAGGGTMYAGWPINHTAPGPIFHVRQGQKVNITMVNNSDTWHSIDFHSAIVPPNIVFADVKQGQTLSVSFVAETPGAFLYHCGTASVLWHIANGMFGAIIVAPADDVLPPADKSYVFVQNEWYTRWLHDKTFTGDYQKMLDMRPDIVAFNGKAFQYNDHPLEVNAGKLTRIYFVNAGPSLFSAFHVIGHIIDTVYESGDLVNDRLSKVSVHPVAPGAGVIFDLTIPQPGQYPFCDHNMANMEKGAMGTFNVK